MNKAFKEALEAGNIEPSILPSGKPLVVDGVQYYQAADGGFKLSVGRFHSFGDVLEQHDRLKLSRGLLETALNAQNSLLKRIRVQIHDTEQVLDAVAELLLINERLEQRQNLGNPMEQIYEIASIFHFADDEDPGLADRTLCKRNIDRWLNAENCGELLAFFLSTPIRNYIPLQGLFETSTLNYLKEDINVLEILDWSRVLLRLKMSGASDVTMSIIESRRETLYGYDGLYRELLKNTTTTEAPGSGPNSEK